LLEGVRTHFETARLSYEADYLKPAKRLLPDLIATKTGLEKVIAFADEVYSALERRGYRVVIAPHTELFHRAEVDEREHPQEPRGLNNLWSPARGTVVYIGTVALGLTIIEMSEQVPARYVDGKYVRETDYVSPKRRRGWADQ
jgi:hypothetical protein